MKGKWCGIVVLAAAGILLLGLANCGRDQQLVSIAIQPSVQTVGASTIPVFEDAGAQVQLRALGSYIHPPVTKDITNQVTWNSNTPQMFTVDSTGLLTATGASCGGTLVSATVTTNKSTGAIGSTGAIVTGYMTANVVCDTSSGGGGGTADALTLTFAGSGTGSVTSAPPNLSCFSPSPCVTQFTDGTQVTLTATPVGTSTFGSWTGCDSDTSTNPCTLTLTGNRTVTVTFN